MCFNEDILVSKKQYDIKFILDLKNKKTNSDQI